MSDNEGAISFFEEHPEAIEEIREDFDDQWAQLRETFAVILAKMSRGAATNDELQEVVSSVFMAGAVCAVRMFTVED